jgi:ComF family protein
LTAYHIGEFVVSSRADLIIPVPLHVKRLRERGFNQAVLLGEILAKQWRLPLSRNNLCRIRWTEPQISLSAGERRDNVRGAFAVREATSVRNRRIILVDDVYTTGSTVAECARTLKKGGAEAVFVATVARAIH